MPSNHQIQNNQAVSNHLTLNWTTACVLFLHPLGVEVKKLFPLLSMHFPQISHSLCVTLPYLPNSLD